MEPFWGLICAGALLGAFFLVYKLASASRTRDLEGVQRSLRDLSHRVHALERQIAERRDAGPVPSAPEEREAVERPLPPRPVAPASEWIETRPESRLEPPPLPPPPAPARVHPEFGEGTSPKPAVSLETFLGGRVMLVAGVVVLLLGVAFFLKYAIDHEWIGAGARIAIGVAAGAALLVVGHAVRRRGFDVFGQALMGCGLGAVYLSNYFACSHYELIAPPAAFALAAGITALGASLALWKDAPTLAYLGFLGGYLAPWLLSKKTGDLAGLTLWLLVLDSGLLAVLLRRAWNGLDLMALAATSVYVAAWFDRYAGRADVGAASGCLGALVAASLALGLVPAIVRRARPTGQALIGLGAAGVLGVVAAHALLFPAHRVELGIAVAVLGAAFFAASRLVTARVEGARAEAESLVGFAAAALVTAVAIVASRSAVSPALSAAGVAIVFAGTRTRHAILLAAGVGAIVLAFGDLLLNRLDLFDSAATPLLSERFFVFVCPCAALLVSGWMMSKVEGLRDSTAVLVGAAGLLVLPLVLAVDVYAGIRPVDDFRRELRFLAPAAVLAVYGVLAARLFGRGSVLGRLFALLPIAFALLFGLTLLFLGHVHAFSPFVNPTFATGVLLVAAARFAAGPTDTRARGALTTAAVVFLLALVTAEIHAWGRTCPIESGTREETEFRAVVWISIAWAAYAAALVGIGFARRQPTLRWIGLGVFALTLLKVFLVDMARLQAVYRIGSFLALGALLVGASFLYQRSRGGEAPREK